MEVYTLSLLSSRKFITQIYCDIYLLGLIKARAAHVDADTLIAAPVS